MLTRLPYRQLHSLEDAQGNFEWIETHLPTGTGTSGPAGGDLTGTYPNPTLSTQGLNKHLQLVAPQQLVMSVGAASFTGIAGPRMANLLQAHTLGRIPKIYLAVPNGWDGYMTVVNWDASNVVLDAVGYVNFGTGSYGFNFLAIG